MLKYVEFCASFSQITNLSEYFTICTSLSQNLTSDQEKLRNNPSMKKKGRILQESRGGSLSRIDRCNRCNVY